MKEDLTMAKTTPDHIERSVLIQAPRDRVWEALTNAKQFGEWFHVHLRGDFEPGETIIGSVTEKDAQGLPVKMEIGLMDHNKLFSWRWHPAAVNPSVDYSREPTTLVQFKLEDAPGGTHLTVVESGFTEIPPERRDAAYRMNYEGWGIQMSRIEDYLSKETA
jgi:uncharacterized protein YndB with AHSA1/START domain